MRPPGCHPPVRTVAPSVATMRAGRRRASSHSTASSPSTIAAVLAVFASTQRRRCDGRRCARRARGPAGARVDDVVQLAARASGGRSCWRSPGRRARIVDAGLAVERRSVIVGDADRPAAGGAAPAIAMSPPRLTSAPQPAARGGRCRRPGRPRAPSPLRRGRAQRPAGPSRLCRSSSSSSGRQSTTVANFGVNPRLAASDESEGVSYPASEGASDHRGHEPLCQFGRTHRDQERPRTERLTRAAAPRAGSAARTPNLERKRSRRGRVGRVRAEERARRGSATGTTTTTRAVVPLPRTRAWRSGHEPPEVATGGAHASAGGSAGASLRRLDTTRRRRRRRGRGPAQAG